MTRLLFNPAEISFAFMHGSFVDGGFFRDIDVGVFVTGVDSADFWEYETRISQQIEEAIYNKFLVEVKVINEAPVSFCYHVIKGQGPLRERRRGSDGIYGADFKGLSGHGFAQA